MEINEYGITLRYDGLDADNHEIELSSLGESIQGFARIISTAAHFAVTQQYSKKVTAQAVKVCATETKANCFTLSAALNWVSQSQIFSGAAGTIAGIIIQYVLTRNSNKTEEMKQISEALKQAIEALGNKDNETIDKLVKVIEKMAIDLKPASRQATSPIGKTCKEISLKAGSVKQSNKAIVTLDENDKAEIDKLEPNEITGIQEFQIYITALDKFKKTAKVCFSTDELSDRINASILDPLLEEENNPYILALDKGELITVIAKASLKNGDILKLHIFDIVPD